LEESITLRKGNSVVLRRPIRRKLSKSWRVRELSDALREIFEETMDWVRWVRAWARIWRAHFAGKSALRAHADVQADKLKMIAAVEETARARGYDIEVVKLSVQPWRCERCGQDKDVFVRPKHVRSTDDLMCASCWLDQSRKDAKPR
jgi:hypothetical protein